MIRQVVLSAVLVSGVASVAWTQTTAPATIDPANFTGRVTGLPSSDIRVLRYTFDPTARTNWHSHAGGQVILVEQGRMRVQERGGSGREVKTRETYVTSPGVEHWHGAVPGEPLTQVAFSFGVTNWLEPVSDQQYTAAAGR